jgi:UDP-N-acetylmuramoyl-tripeptide--D-alanyl-D-alanine ligase
VKALPLGQVSEWSGAELLQGDPERCVHRICTDSRQIRPGDLFVALEGEYFDGHDYLASAVKGGAVAVLVSRAPDPEEVAPEIGVLKGNDTLELLQALASGYRQSMNCQVVAVTGSSGKTSTKEMIAAVLSEKFSVHKTQGNLNNHIGTPLTLLEIDEEHEWAVVEIGMNRPGEILILAKMARPDISVITNIGWAHIAAFRSREDIAKEKCDILRPLAPEACAIINIEDPFLERAQEVTRAKIRRVGESPDCHVCFRDTVMEEGKMRFRLEGPGFSLDTMIPYPDIHMVENAVLAAEVGLQAGVSPEAIVAGLARVKFPAGRLALYPWDGGWLLDDSYNANPDSMAAAFRSLSLVGGEGRKIALLGCMGELGDFSEELHVWVGHRLGAENFDSVYGVGDEAEVLCHAAARAGLPEENCHVCNSNAAVVEGYMKDHASGDRVLVKGSRLLKMEEVVDQLRKAVN